MRTIRSFMYLALFTVIFVLGSGLFSYSRTITAVVSKRTVGEPIIVKGYLVSVGKRGCLLRVLSQTYRGDILKIKGPCLMYENSKIVYGVFDGRRFVFVRGER